MNMYPQMETPGGTCTPKQKYEWACCQNAENPILELLPSQKLC